MSNKFHRGERLKSRKEIGRLFGRDGRSLTAYPLRLVFAEVAERRGDFPFQAAFVVPKRRFKRAVDRNLIKRRVREAFRLQKHLIGAHTRVTGEDSKEPGEVAQYALMFIYTGKEAMPYKYIERKMRKLLGQLGEEIGELNHAGLPCCHGRLRAVAGLPLYHSSAARTRPWCQRSNILSRLDELATRPALSCPSP